jgi:hypothetical protein
MPLEAWRRFILPSERWWRIWFDQTYVHELNEANFSAEARLDPSNSRTLKYPSRLLSLPSS